MAKKKNSKNKETLFDRLNLSPETQRWIFGILMFLVAIIIALSFFNLAGIVGIFLMKILPFLIGRTLFVLPLFFALSGLLVLSTKYENFFWQVILTILILTLGLSGILGSLNGGARQGGWLGFVVSFPLISAFGFWVTQIIFGTMVIIGGLIFWNLSPRISPKETGAPATERDSFVLRTIKKVRGSPKFKVKTLEPKRETPEFEPESFLSPELKQKPIAGAKIFSFQPPPISLLESERGVPNSGDIRANSAIIKKTLQNFGIEVEMSEVNVGPTVTQYTLKPAEGVMLSKITALSNNLSLALASHPLRIEAPIPGRPLVGIEVPNKARTYVRLRNLIENPNFQNPSAALNLALGKDVAGNPVLASLAKMPHLLVAGATGTGKTIFLNSLVLSLLYQPSSSVNPFGGGPEILRFILIDPKRVEFTAYNQLPHLLCPVIYDAVKTINVLKWLTGEMERRFEVLAAAKAKDITSYNIEYLKTLKGQPSEQVLAKEKLINEKKMDSELPAQEPENEDLELLPYIVLIIDELADLMAARGREIEAGIVRLAQMARAVGIHLVVATQRPSVEVITGLIKANITSRVTFQVAAQVDSRTVLDVAGAERLLGLGDMLYISAETIKPKRIQGAYVSDKEVRKIVKYIKSEAKVPFSIQDLEIREGIENGLTSSLEESLKESGEKFGASFVQDDPLYEEAKKMVLEAKKASASLLQRRLRVGYARAARLIDTLEEKGVVGPADGAKPRQILYRTEAQQKEIDSGWEKV